MKHIRNFCIIAHIDHGKSTLADRILESTHTIAPREMQEQVLDQMDLERERGITIKSHPVAITYDTGSETYRLNLIDTPGHVDFSYEVSRSLTACEGALLLVDATQGVEAQTLANYFLALENGLTIIPVINKIDMPMAEIERTKAEIEKVLGMPAADAILISAKTGTGVDSVMHAIVERIPPPQGSSGAPLKALIFDSHYDSYRGVVPFVRVFAGTLSKGVKIKTMSNEMEFEVAEVGIFTPEMLPVDSLAAGEVGYIMAGIKNIEDTKVGDTITYAQNSALEPLPGYRPIKPMVYCGIYPVDTLDYENLRESLLKLRLNDAALVFEPETSIALGFGFRCGFLGLLHMEIVQERLEREYGLNLIATAPSVVYHILKTNGDILEIDNPEHFPDPTHIDAIEEPMIKATLMTPSDYIGGIMDLAQNHRGTFINMEYLGENRCIIHYAFPLSEIITNFFDQLKSRTRGYASFDYEFTGYKEADLVKLDIMVNRQRVDALSIIVHKDNAYNYSRKLVDKLKAVIPRQLFEVPIQAAIGGKIIARETIRAMRKNVLAKCYGGDITRKRKLLEKQKEGKKRMKQIGNVDIPQDAFLAVLKVDTEE